MKIKFTGKDLIKLGFDPGQAMGELITELDSAAEIQPLDTVQEVQQAIMDRYQLSMEANRKEMDARRVKKLDSGVKVHYNIEAENEDEVENIANVTKIMDEVVKTPTIVSAAVMPDACPCGGSIPVGGVVGAKMAIHPAYHSADICCSMYATDFGKADPKTILDAVQKVTHFGPGGRDRDAQIRPPVELLDQLQSDNPFLQNQKFLSAARSHLVTQGDGNHFSFVGVSEATGNTFLVSHHGSRGPGAMLYSAGMKVAEKWRKEICPELAKDHAYIPYDTEDGQNYWDALQVIRSWTKYNHQLLHREAANAANVVRESDFWNEHNFVFKDGDIFYHGKGATPIHAGLMPDSSGVQIVPLNMGQPILFVKGQRTETNLGFAPHGAGRNLSRTAYKKRLGDESDAAVFARETVGIDARFFNNIIDVSELPRAYKDADSIRRAMAKFGLCDVVDLIQPYGCIMAGEMIPFWMAKKLAKKAAQQTGAQQ